MKEMVKTIVNQALVLVALTLRLTLIKITLRVEMRSWLSTIDRGTLIQSA
jgi:hypothetical protein